MQIYISPLSILIDKTNRIYLYQKAKNIEDSMCRFTANNVEMLSGSEYKIIISTDKARLKLRHTLLIQSS